MGFWLSDGTVSLVSNSKTVTGTGTAFKSGANPARVGQSLIVYVGGNTAIYEIERVDSDSSMQIAIPWRGATINNAPYAINTASEGSPSDLSRRAAQVMGYYQGQLDVIQALLVGTGNVSATLPDGTVVILPSWSSLASAEDISEVEKKISGKQDASKILASLSALNASAETIPFFSGKDVASTTALTELSRRIMASPAAADIRALLQLGTASVKNTGISDGDVMALGSLGYGGISVRPVSGNQNNAKQSGIYYNGASEINGPYPNAAANIIANTWGVDPRWRSELALSVSVNRMHFRSILSDQSGATSWVEVRHTGNTTVDANGFIKNASPIMRLHGSDDDSLLYLYRDEQWEKAGVSIVNGEAVGATAARGGVGHYIVTGSFGFARDGWYIETPNDANGNKLLFVRYQQHDDGVIEIWTSSPDYSSGRCAEGEPVDIPAGRWIDLRLCMDDRDISLAS